LTVVSRGLAASAKTPHHRQALSPRWNVPSRNVAVRRIGVECTGIRGLLLAYPSQERAAMAAAAETRPDVPGSAEVRAQVERMAVSDVLRTSPQLVSFLRFVVDAELSGRSNRIKGYTIAVEVLRRDAKFDPRLDPIVRVEAGRLRRAIDRYYRTLGADDRVIIDLPRGGYVPIFRWREPGAHAGAPAAAPADRQTDTRGAIVDMRAWPGGRAFRQLGVLVVVVALLLGSAILLASRLREPPVAGNTNAPERPPVKLADTKLPGNGMPVMAVDVFDVVGTPGPHSIMSGSLRERLSDAFSRFDLVNIVEEGAQKTAAATPLAAQYRFGGALEYDAEGGVRMSFRVVDAADGKVVWSQVFERIKPADDRAAAEEAIVRQLAPTLLQPFGVLYAYGRSRSIESGAGDPRYRCILDAAESFRSFDVAQHLRARACLEALTATDASFAIGFSYLAAVYLREYQYGLGVREGDPPVLDRALRAARRGVELNPASSRAYEMMFAVLFARGDLPAAFAAGDKAIALNPYDSRSRGTYAARLIASGETDKGMDMLTQLSADGSILPAFEQFFLFLGSYLRGDLTHAALYAGQLTSDTFQLGLLARILIASANGDRVAAFRTADQLVALNPAWRNDLRGTLRRFFASDAIIDRLVRDLDAAGVGRS
jgi:TolB-like protein